MKSRKIWIGIGAALSTQAVADVPRAPTVMAADSAMVARGPATAPPVAQRVAQAAKPADTEAPKAAAGSGGEGGEGGENGEKKVPNGPMLEAKEFNTALAKTLVDDLREGGYVIYFRHFETGEDTPDYINATLGKCATQRQLNADGAVQAITMRDVFQKLKVPVAKVLSSPYCRAWQSADLAFGGHTTVEGLKLPKSKTKDFDVGAMKAMETTLRPLLAEKPKAGTNTVIVAHDDNMTAIGQPYPEAQGEALLFKPDGNKFKLIMQIKPDAWKLVAAQ